MAPRTHWLFGDQLGPHFLDPRSDGPDAHAPVLMIEARSVLRRRRFHRAKAHLVLSAMRHRAAELGDRVRYVQADTYAEGLAEAGFDGRGNRLTVCHPTSRAALDFVTVRDEVDVLPACGFLLPQAEFEAWAKEHTGDRLRMEGFYRWVRRRHELLMDGDEPAGGPGTSTTTTASRRPGGVRPWRRPLRTARPRTGSTTRCATTSTAGSVTGTSRSSAATARAASPSPGGRRWPRSGASSRTGSAISAATRTRCSRPTPR